MGKKPKEGSVNLYYLKKDNLKKDKSVSEAKNNNKKKAVAKKKSVSKAKENKDKFNFDDEIVIGVTKNKDKETERKTNHKNVKKQKRNLASKKKVQNIKKNNKEKPRNTFKIFKYILIICVLLVAVICFMLSPIFNISEIKVNGNDKISAEQIISLSEIEMGENIYKINKYNSINKIKQNAYIEDVQIKRKLPSVVEINIKERQATYMLEYVNSYAYINNQGYILEISDMKIDKPIIIGILTESDYIKEGNRLVEEDLTKLEDILKIMESATSNEIEKLITKIDISDRFNYKLYLDSEEKTVKLGDITDISTKMLHIKAILEKESGIKGEIIVNSISENNKSRFIQKIN